MTLEQIMLQPVDPFERLFAWHGFSTVHGYISWKLYDVAAGYAVCGITSRSFLMDVDKAQYMDGLISSFDERCSSATYQRNNYADDPGSDWEYGTKENFIKWLCRELKVPYDG